MYNGNCLDSCPINTTVPSGSICTTCQSPCQTCSLSQYNCTSCVSGKYLYYYSCVSVCPSGYKIQDKECVACENPGCLNSTTNGTTPNNTSNYTKVYAENGTVFTGDPVPFPFTDITIGTGLVIGVTKLTASGVSFLPSIISIWGFVSAVSWGFLAIYVSSGGDIQYSRRLTILDSNTGSDLIVSIIIIIILGALAFHIVCNVFYTSAFLLRT